jgi:hypothetical protein
MYQHKNWLENLEVISPSYSHLILSKEAKNILWGKNQPLQQLMLGKLDIHRYKTKTRSSSLILYKIKSKWSKDLNIKPKTVKLVEESIGKHFRYKYRRQLSEQNSNVSGNNSKK